VIQSLGVCLFLSAIHLPVDESFAIRSEIDSSAAFVAESSQADTSGNGARTVAVIAHRGVPTLAPENTLAAFRKALELGVDMLEVDVQQTKDGHLVVLHDTKVDRTTDGRGTLRDFTLEELKSLDAGNWFAEAFRNEPIPTLKEVVSILDAGTILLLEIKYGSPYHMGIEARLVEFIRQHRLDHRVLIKSFDPDVVRLVRRLAPDIPVGISILFRIPFFSLIVHRGIRFGDVLKEDVDFLHVHRIGLTQALIDDAHARGMQVIAWDVHDEGTMRKAIAMGVDAIETDEPELLKKLRPRGTPKQIGRRGR
jgi:glycerophosphoryl diester phosphodiesterase